MPSESPPCAVVVSTERSCGHPEEAHMEGAASIAGEPYEGPICLPCSMSSVDEIQAACHSYRPEGEIR